MVIKIVLIAAVVMVALVMGRGHGARRQALRRLGLAAFAGLAVASILQPDMLTWVAQKINVGRGADLLLYALIVVFLSYVSTRHVRDQRTWRQLTALARRVALLEAPAPRAAGAAGVAPGVAAPRGAAPGAAGAAGVAPGGAAPGAAGAAPGGAAPGAAGESGQEPS
ncbi:MAG: DUF2304 domain-containing protein [Bifidobacteriaceae bacterium]|nr:DUF2304 domain-containing protein [Bifidobacteriaceae bacterium]